MAKAEDQIASASAAGIRQSCQALLCGDTARRRVFFPSSDRRFQDLVQRIGLS